MDQTDCGGGSRVPEASRRRARIALESADATAEDTQMAQHPDAGQRLQAKDLHPDVFKLFDRYVHGFIDRRDFLESVSRFAVGGVTAAAILDAFTPNVNAQQVSPEDTRI